MACLGQLFFSGRDYIRDIALLRLPCFLDAVLQPALST